MAQPWDRKADEGEEAYQAFLAYRDTPPPRNSLEVYRQFRGNPGASQASGTWNRWAKAFR